MNQSKTYIGRKLRIDQLEPRAMLDAAPMLIELAPGSTSSSPVLYTEVSGATYFVANDGVHGAELWRSDGTITGTSLVKDIRPGSASGITIDGQLTNVSGTLFFKANNGTEGFELWKSDGTESGTVLVKDIRPGASPSSDYDGPRNLINVGGTLFFAANNGSNGKELWKSDGTSAGTTMIKDIRAGASGSSPTALTEVNGLAYFSANGRIWRSDGTAIGTVQLTDTTSGQYNLTNVSGTLFFTASPTSTNDDRELWKVQGSSTVLVKDINSSNFGSKGSDPSELTNVSGSLYFSAASSVGYFGSTDRELWKSDGTAGGTVRVKDIVPGTFNSYGPESLRNVGGTLYFKARESVGIGYELWKSDGTSAGTSMVKSINPGSGDAVTRDSSYAEFGGLLYFTANDGVGGSELWKTDGEVAGTVIVADISLGASGSAPRNLTAVGSKLFFSADVVGSGRELWVLDSTPTFPLGDYNHDNTVNSDDHTFWAANFGATGGVGLQADGNGDGAVDAADYTIWRDLFTPPAVIAMTVSEASRVTITSATTTVVDWPGSKSLLSTGALDSTALQVRTRGKTSSPRQEISLANRDEAFARLATERRNNARLELELLFDSQAADLQEKHGPSSEGHQTLGRKRLLSKELAGALCIQRESELSGTTDS